MFGPLRGPSSCLGHCAEGELISPRNHTYGYRRANRKIRRNTGRRDLQWPGYHSGRNGNVFRNFLLQKCEKAYADGLLGLSRPGVTVSPVRLYSVVMTSLSVDVRL